MSLGTNPENFLFLFIGLLAALPAAIGLLWLGVLVQRLLRIKSGFFSVVFLSLLFISPFLGASLYLDMAGTVVKAQVQTREERIHYREEGDWQQDYRITVQYTLADQPPLTASFAPDPATFDHLHKGDSINVRAVILGGWFSYMRLANQSTFTWLPWRWIGIGVAVMCAGWLLWQFSKRTWVGWVVIGMILLVLVVSPVAFKLLEWQRSQDPSLTPLRATGTVQEVQRVTQLDPLPSNRSSDENWDTRIDVPQPYDIVVVRFTPQGHDQPILGVDVVDANHPTVKADTQVEVAYGVNEPRTVRLLSAQRSHFWKNPIGWFGDQLTALAVIVLVIVGFTWLGNQGQKWLARRSDRTLPR